MALNGANKGRFGRISFAGSVLPTVLAVSVVILTGLTGLLVLYQNESLLFARGSRLRQARADVQSAYTLYRFSPDHAELLNPDGYRLFDSLPTSKVHVQVQPWGLYEWVRVATADSLVRTARLFGAAPDPQQTLCYADSHHVVTLAGDTRLHGLLHLPEQGWTYGRIHAHFFCGREIPHTSVRHARAALLPPTVAAETRLAHLFAAAPTTGTESFPDSLFRSFVHDPPAVLRLGRAEIGDCRLLGRIVLYADELRIDSTCRLEHPIVCARKITVGHGARLTAQLFARDTVLVEERAVLEHPSGIYAQQYAELGDEAAVNGYVIVRDTMQRKRKTANYKQARTARVRGLVWVDGVAQVQGLVAGRLVLREATYFAPEGYYEHALYDLTLLENPLTAQPLWLAADPKRRKEAACVE